MGISFKFIVIYLMCELSKRNMPLIINKSDLVDAISCLIDSLPISLEKNNYIRLAFEFNYEMDDLMNKYYSQFEEDEEYIMYNVEYLNEMELLLGNELNESDVAKNTFPYLKGNVNVLECIGIKFKKDLYQYLFDIEYEIERKYIRLRKADNNFFEDRRRTMIIKELKKLILKKKIMFLNIKNLLSEQENIDLYYYARHLTNEVDCSLDVDTLFSNFDAHIILDDSIQRSLFLNVGNAFFSLRDQLLLNVKPDGEIYRNSRIVFYKTFLSKIDEEIKKCNKKSYKREFTNVKYKLMYMLDSVYDTNLFMGKNEIENGNFEGKYDFIKSEVYYLIDEVLSYDDTEYRTKYDVNTMMFNIIKKIIIETYYELTSDKEVLEAIETSRFYDKNSISAKLFNNIVKKVKKKMREKE